MTERAEGWITKCAQCGCLAFTSWPSDVPEDRSVLCHCPGVAWAEPVRWLESGEAWPDDLVPALRCKWSQTPIDDRTQPHAFMHAEHCASCAAARPWRV